MVLWAYNGKHLLDGSILNIKLMNIKVLAQCQAHGQAQQSLKVFVMPNHVYSAQVMTQAIQITCATDLLTLHYHLLLSLILAIFTIEHSCAPT